MRGPANLPWLYPGLCLGWPGETRTAALPSGRARQASGRASAGRDAKIDWKVLSERIGHSDVAFTMRQYVQTDLEVHRQVATTLAELIVGGVVPGAQSPASRGNGPDASV